MVECRALLGKYPSITYLEHESATVHLSDASGLPTSFNVFASPYSPTTGKWAFGYESLASGRHQAVSVVKGAQSETTEFPPGDKGELLWSTIPSNTDVLITHTPPMGHCDAGRDDRSCKALRRALRRVRPMMMVCGHVHEGWGAEMIHWESEVGESNTSGYASEPITLPKDGKKQARIDLRTSAQPRKQGPNPISGHSKAESRSSGDNTETTDHSDLVQDSDDDGETKNPETCVINAAIMAHSKGASMGGKRYNKPIIIDLSLPVN